MTWVSVHDGHGGDFASQWLAERLHRAFASALAGNSKQASDVNERIKTALLDAHRETDKQLLAAQAEDRLDDGACSVVCLCVASPPATAAAPARTVWVANVGDCKAVLARTKSKAGEATLIRAIRLTKDHSPILLEERKRIEAAGGRVDDGRVNGALGVSRSFGDPRFKKAGVVSQPDIVKFSLGPDERFLLLACDGLWSVMTPDTAVAHVKQQLQEAWQHEIDHPTVTSELKSLQRKETPAQAVCRKAVTKLITHAVVELGAKDNTTAILVCFEHDGQPFPGLPKEIMEEANKSTPAPSSASGNGTSAAGAAAEKR